MNTEHRTPTAATYNQDEGAYIEQRADETSALDYDHRLSQVRMVFYTDAAAAAAKQFYEDAHIQHYLTTKKRLINRVRSVMRVHNPARG